MRALNGRLEAQSCHSSALAQVANIGSSKSDSLLVSLFGVGMDWLRQPAMWLREWLAQQPWLEGWHETIEATPDLALVAAGPGFLMLLAILVLVQAPRGKRVTERPEKDEAQPMSATSVVSAVAPQLQQPAPAVNATPAVRNADPAQAAAPPASRPASRVRRASGVPDENEQERKARVFLSSTFRDMRAEREVLATDTFPSLKRKFRARGVEVQEVDLRWGVNEGDATLDICLQAVKRSNWFVGLMGQRYGTTLEDEATVAQLGPDFPAVREGLGRSLTEIEILEGVLLNTKGEKQTLFFERDPAWLDTLNSSERPEYEDQNADAQTKLADLKTRIRERVGAMHAYASPKEIAAGFEQTMSAALEKAFPPVEGTDDPLMQEHRLHAAYARERLGLYVGGEDYLNQLDAWMAQYDAPPKIAVGASGGGKSTLIAHWTSRWARTQPNDIVFAHYLGASPDSANPAALVRRLWLHLNRITGDDIAIPSPDTELGDLREQVSDRLAQAACFASREKCSILIALDGLDKLSDEHRDLRWWPRVLPPRVRVLASSLDGKARDAARERNWSELVVRPFAAAEQSAFIADTLKGWDKNDFPEVRKQRVLSHALASLPLFLKTILEELRVSAANDVLDARLDGYLTALVMPDLYARILAQIERECGEEFVAQALSLIWASRVGLEEDEIVAITSETKRIARGPAGLAWERLRNRLADNLRDSQGRITFSHDYLRQAVEAQYLKSEDAKRRAHLDIAGSFATREPDKRQAEELPYQLRAAEAWDRLEALLLDLDRFDLLRARGSVELLSFWMPLRRLGRNPEVMLSKFRIRYGVPQTWVVEAIEQALRLASFLRFAGSRGERLLRFNQDVCSAVEALQQLASDAGEQGELFAVQKMAQEELARTLAALGEHQDATKHAEYWAIWSQGGSGTIGLASMLILAESYCESGDLHSAQEVAAKALELATRECGEEHPLTVESMKQLALTRAARGDLEGAQTLQERVLQARTRTSGAEHPDTLTIMGNLALTLKARGDLEGAQRHEERVLEVRTRILGPEHPDTLTSMLNLASTLRDRGDLESALQRAEQVRAAAMRQFGIEHTLSKTASDWIVEFKGEFKERTKH
jgi:nephrocystin-3